MVVALCCAIGSLLFAVTVAIGDGDGGGSDSPGVSARSGVLGGGSPIPTGGSDPNSPPDGNLALVSTQERVSTHEALPCTGPKEPINFETFSAGPSPAGLSLTGASRRCDATAPDHEWPANYVNYSYGSCEISKGATGCQPPLAIQTWPACQRSMGDYSYDGKPLPHRVLPRLGGAEVVEFDLPMENRLEVYTKSATIVIFATNPALGRKALELLRPQENGKPVATRAVELEGAAPDGLEPPNDGAMEGVLSCRS